MPGIVICGLILSKIENASFSQMWLFLYSQTKNGIADHAPPPDPWMAVADREQPTKSKWNAEPETFLFVFEILAAIWK